MVSFKGLPSFMASFPTYRTSKKSREPQLNLFVPSPMALWFPLMDSPIPSFPIRQRHAPGRAERRQDVAQSLEKLRKGQAQLKEERASGRSLGARRPHEEGGRLFWASQRAGWIKNGTVSAGHAFLVEETYYIFVGVA